MRHVDRLPEPDILASNREAWQRRYDRARRERPGVRPGSDTYAHPEIREALALSSSHKCFYCETLLKGEESQVDHHIELADAPELAFSWENLYLSCPNCNRKLPHRSIPVDTVLDPCKAKDSEIFGALTFHDNLILPHHGSQRGRDTIRKYRLSTPLLDERRFRYLSLIVRHVQSIQDCMRREGRTTLNTMERHRIMAYMFPDAPFSLMAFTYIHDVFGPLLAAR